MIITIILLTLISRAHAATFTETTATGYCTGYGMQAVTPADQTLSQCQAILDPVVEKGGACMGTGGNARVTPYYTTAATCESGTHGNDCCRNTGCTYPCVWQALTGDSPYYIIIEPCEEGATPVFRTGGYGDLSTSLSQADCVALYASGGYSWGGTDSWTGQATGCSLVPSDNNKLKYNTNENSPQGCTGGVQCIDAGAPGYCYTSASICSFCTSAALNAGDAVQYSVVATAPPPDFYDASDPETDPYADNVWQTEDIACGVNHFVSIGSNNQFSCVSCDGDGIDSGEDLFLEEYSRSRGATEGTGIHHGKCCINGHHKVCQQLLKTYKDNCLDDLDDKGHTETVNGNRKCSDPSRTTCNAIEPDLSGANIIQLAGDACDGTLVGGTCAHTCDNGFTGGSITCGSDGTYTVVACT
jgi:hypothetical protein